MSTWTVDNDARLASLLNYELEAEPLADFIRRVSPRLPPPPHIAPLMKIWERTRREAVRVVIEMPPRHGKSITAMHALVWRMTLDPALRHAYITYGDRLSLKHSRFARRLAREAGVKLMSDSQSVQEWETEEGGGFNATSVGGSLTGKGVDGVAVIDDPHKDRAEAESRNARDKIWDWFTDTFWSRLEEDASVLIPLTRWHIDDLAGRVLKGFEDPETGEIVQFEELRLPALAEENDPLGRAVGEALWPERVNAKKLHGIRAIMGPYGFGSEYQQAPRPRGDRLFYEPGRFKLADWEPDGHRFLIVCDPAASERTRADYTAVLVLACRGYGLNMHAWVVDHFRGQVTIPKVVRRLVDFQARWFGVPIAVESVGVGRGVPDMLREHDPSLRVLDVIPVGDKFTRAQPVASAWNDGRVQVPLDAPWATELINECQDFTGVSDLHDDQVDCLAHGWNVLFAAKIPRRRGPRRGQHLPFG